MAQTQKRNGTLVTLDAEVAFHEACGSPARLRMLLALLESGELGVTTLGEIAKASASATSQHLGRLRDRGIVVRRREAQQQFYSLAAAYRDAVAQVAARVGGER